jgi:hypothetical protein
MILAAEKKIDVLTLLPYSSQISQPCDKEVNAELKRSLNSFMKQPTTTGIELQRESLCRTLCVGVQCALRMDVVEKAFRSAGVLFGQRNNALYKLPDFPPIAPSPLSPRRRSSYQTGGKVLTDTVELQMWGAAEGFDQELEGRKGDAGGKKRKWKVINDDEDSEEGKSPFQEGKESEVELEQTSPLVPGEETLEISGEVERESPRRSPMMGDDEYNEEMFLMGMT